MTPRLKPLLLPQLVEQRLGGRTEKQQVNEHGNGSSTMAAPDQGDLSFVYYTTNSSASDITSPVTPIFSPKGHNRFSSSTSSLELPMQMPQECPASPSQTSSAMSTLRQLPDVEEEPLDRGEDTATLSDQFGLYSCLCDQACSHRNSSESKFQGDFVSEFDIDYDMGFLSDTDFTTDPRYPRKKRSTTEAALSEFTSRLGSRMPSLKRWRSTKRAALRASPTTGLSLENVLARGSISSRSSSMSAPTHHLPERALESMPPVPSNPTMTFYSHGDDVETGLGLDISPEDHSNLARDRSMATTPLLPPLLTSTLAGPPRESPLQSPKVETSPTPDAPLSPAFGAPAQFSRPALSSRPSMSSLRNVSSSTELPLPLPSILQEHDEWSDRLGHANFTISPQPYELETINQETIAKFRNDWDLARTNYTKHLVRTGENYGQTSKIYALTEAKWAEVERRWQTTFGDIVKNTNRATAASAGASRNHSRGRGRGRSSSSNAAALARLPAQDDLVAELEWRRLEDCLPSAVPQMLESLDADGKFPGRGDEDIVGPMQRDAVMVRARSEDAKGRFWKTLADRVGLRK
ncbi:uncharacterized protein MAM_07782 [Metarhizium album ARSEF 1941]|uniref:Only prolin and serin are matching in the corresponding protein n=1 Tax=Metarhizium album (strain ARSEF 1941) TaxID=1081103 RepID=A0A0B2WKB1_METAS|nr:uncharacterized protein MAM_07782 [Metarhizium album ARSEF 1941]KHN94353.1 hypothetical protein MAM_07782 [Metarhizium album ARSEF 1941]